MTTSLFDCLLHRLRHPRYTLGYSMHPRVAKEFRDAGPGNDFELESPSEEVKHCKWGKSRAKDRWMNVPGEEMRTSIRTRAMTWHQTL